MAVKVLQSFVVVTALLGCTATGTPAPESAARVVAPDVHGEVLSLLPPGAVAWVRLDVATLRRSPNYDGALEMARSLGADLPMVQRELGVDVFHQGDMAALAIYAPPGRGQAGWPMAVVRGRFDRAAILADARARVPNATPSEVTERGLTFTVIGQRAYLFPASDVMVVTERALVRRVAARLTGQEAHSVIEDDRFRALLARVGGDDKPARFVVDLEAIRGLQEVRVRGVPQADTLNTVAGWVEIPEASSARLVGTTSTARAATEVAQIVTREGRRMGGLLPVRLLGLGRFLSEGIQARAEGEVVTVNLDASRDETRRLFRIATILDDLDGGSE